MQCWLMKTEPSTWSWDDQIRKKITHWDGVRNYQASNNLKAMRVDDLCFFYHSGEDRKIMGIVEIIRSYYPDPSDLTKRFGMVDVKVIKALKHPVSLQDIKKEPCLAHLALIRQSRLSVMPIDETAWKFILQMGGEV